MGDDPATRQNQPSQAREMPGLLHDFGDRREFTAAGGGLRAIRAEPPPPADPVLTADAGAMRELLARLDPG